MVVSRSNCKPMSNKVNGNVIEKYGNQNGSIVEPIMVVCNSSDEEGNLSSSFGTIEKPTTVITISDDDVIESGRHDFLSDRPKRNIERTNYNQAKMMKELYRQNKPNKTSPSNIVKVKRQSKENMKLTKVAERTLRRLAKQDEPELKPPTNAIDIENLLSSISPIKKSSSPLKSSNVKRSKAAQEETKDSKFAKISNRAFRYPWEWQNAQKSSNPSQILGFRTLNDGLCETLMCRK